MSGDSDLDRIMARRLAEMRSAARQGAEPQEARRPARDALVSVLGHRGVEVLERAEAQFPQQAGVVVSQLARLIESGQLNQTIDGGQLLQVFRMLGLNVRMPTRISVERDGKMASLSERIRGMDEID